MTLALYTSRVSYAGSDRLDISRKSGDEFGRVFAPSWEILRPALDAMKAAKQLRLDGHAADGDAMASDAWATYTRFFTVEMRASYVRDRVRWHLLLDRREATLVCYCTDATRCHRTLVAGMLSKLGANYRGER
jgi:uncharacterized protein YeaO (DUF488 family)